VWQDTFLLFGAQLFYRLSGVVLLMVLSRSLSAETLGVYFFSCSFAESFITLASFQLNPVLMRRVATDPEHGDVHLASLLGLRIVSSVIYGVCVVGAAVVFARAIWPVITVAACFTVLENLYFSFGSLFLAVRKVIYNVQIGVVVQTLFLAVFLAGMWWAPSLETLLAVNFFRASCLAGAALTLTHRRVFPLRVAWDWGFLREGIPFTLLSFLVVLQNKADTLLLGVLTDYHTVGHYQLAFRVVIASLFVPMVMNSVLFPQIAAHRLSTANRRLLITRAGVLLILGVMGTGVVWEGATVLTSLLYGGLAAEVAPLLRPMAFLFPITFLRLLCSSALLALSYETRVLQVSALGVGTNLLANGALIPVYGVYGAVYARLASELLECGIFAGYLWHFMSLTDSLAAEKSPGSDATPNTSQEKE
jgi:O-antigen/teichoic acid export membrane protein